MRTALIVIIIVIAARVAEAHPSQNISPRDVPQGVYPAFGCHESLTIGDLTFSPSLDVSSLSTEEAYILVGGESQTASLLPWWQEWKFVISNLLSGDQPLPSSPTPEQVLEALGVASDTEGNAVVERLQSPISGRMPRLDASEFSPGDMYVRKLSEAELEHFAKLDPQLAAALAGRSLAMPGRNVMLGGPVFYLRVYGREQTILEKIVYTPVMAP